MKNTYDLQLAAERVIGDLNFIREKTATDEEGAMRIAWTPLWQKTRDWFKELVEDIGAEVTMDSAGNVWAKIEGKSKKAVIIGSHLDSVPNGGWLDGVSGVMVGVEALRRYTDFSEKPEKTIYVVDWADEEGARYGYSCVGSSATSNSLDIEELRGREDSNGIKFEDAVAEYGVHLDEMLHAKQEFEDKNIVAYLELHIEYIGMKMKYRFYGFTKDRWKFK